MKQKTFLIEDDINKKLSNESHKTRVGQGQIINEALRDWLRRGREVIEKEKKSK